ncbi:MAG: hypothetical protein JWM86_960 [Thermoleophilia bacterium]|nr:hypothetical protein [Thermoleophilia bacterium]
MDTINRTRTVGNSPAVTYARIFGIVLTLVGILGLLVNAEQDSVESLLGFDVNLTHNLVHLATGVLGLIVGFKVLSQARTYAIVLGVVYTALGIWGLTAGDGFDPFDLFVNINPADHVLHLAIGILGIGAFIASKSRDNDLDRDRV